MQKEEGSGVEPLRKASRRCPRYRQAIDKFKPSYRESPFTRRPRHEQVEWLVAIMQDGKWHTPFLIAKSVARDQSELRYLRRSIQSRMREMHEEERLDRRQSPVAGAMFDYKLKKT